MTTDRDGARRRDPGSYVEEDSERTTGATYTELLQLGRGGFSTISVALARGIGGFSKLVVLKALREEMIAQPDVARMFLEEARLTARMTHPNIVQVYEVFRRGTATVIVMEYVDGQPLSVILTQSRDSGLLTLDLGVSILAKVLSALQYVHTLCDFSGAPLGLVHRDVSPHNVMVTYDGQVKLVDFGIAKLASTEHTSTGVIKGKITYMAPEQFVGETDHRADIFAVGVMLWELITRRRFWAGLPEPTVMRRLVAGDLPRLRETSEQDFELARICERALMPTPSHRYATASAMQDDLERYLNRRGIHVSQAAIGKFVADTCMDARRKVQAAIRSRLQTIGVSLTDESNATEAETRTESRPKVECATESESINAPTEVDPAFVTPRSRLWVGVISTSVGLLVTLAILLRLGPGPSLDRIASWFSRTSEQRLPERPASNSATAMPPTVPATVRLRGSAQPANATWYLDDRRLGTDPLDTSVPRDDAEHVLRAEADGYTPFTRAVRLEADLNVAVVLALKPSGLSRRADMPAASPPSAGKARAAQSRVSSAVSTITIPATKPVEIATAPPPIPTAPAKSAKEREPAAPQFGDNLKGGASNLERPRRAIEDTYPGGGAEPIAAPSH